MGHDWNPRYVIYANLKGMTPDECLEADKVAYPGGCMCGFILWINAQRCSFKRAHPEAFMFGNIADQAAWDTWLQKGV